MQCDNHQPRSLIIADRARGSPAAQRRLVSVDTSYILPVSSFICGYVITRLASCHYVAVCRPLLKSYLTDLIDYLLSMIAVVAH